MAFLDEQIAEQGGRVAQDTPHVFAEKDEDAAVEKTLGEADQLAARASEVWICLNESVIDELAIVAVFAVEIFFDGFLTNDLIAQQAIDLGRAASGEQHVGLEEPPENEAAKGSSWGFREQGWLGGGAGVCEHEALILAAAEAAHVEPELIHVRD